MYALCITIYNNKYPVKSIIFWTFEKKIYALPVIDNL